MRRAPQAGDARGDRRERVGARRRAQAHRRRRRVLLVVGVQDEDAVERAHQHVVDLVVLARRGEHHPHEVRRVREVVARVHVRLADRVLVGHRDQRRQLGDQPDRRDVALVRVVQVHRVRIERRQRADEAGQHRHRMRVAAEAAHEELHLLVDHRVVGHAAHEVLLLRGVRQLAVEQQVADLEEVALHRELLDRIAAVEELALVAVDVGDRRVARGGRQEARVVGELAGLAVQRADVDHVRADRPRAGSGSVTGGEPSEKVSVAVRSVMAYRLQAAVDRADRRRSSGAPQLDRVSRCATSSRHAAQRRRGSHAAGSRSHRSLSGRSSSRSSAATRRRSATRRRRDRGSRSSIEVVLQHAAPAAPAHRGSARAIEVVLQHAAPAAPAQAIAGVACSESACTLIRPRASP